MHALQSSWTQNNQPKFWRGQSLVYVLSMFIFAIFTRAYQKCVIIKNDFCLKLPNIYIQS